MPTDAEFRDAAALLRRVAEDVDAARRHLAEARHNDGIDGGSIAATVEAACERHASDVVSIRDRIWQQVDECERRAIVCAEHAMALRAWQSRHEHWSDAARRYRFARDVPDRDVAWPGPPPVRPTAPYDWVDPR